MKAHHFLIVDDQPFVRSLIQAMLSRLDVRFSFAATGEAALKILSGDGDGEGNDVTCVISDWHMFPVDGLQLLKEIRTAATPGIPRNLPFIMMSSHVDSKAVTAAADLDVSAYLAKPVSSDRLAEAVRLIDCAPLKPKPASFYRRVELVELPKQETPADNGKYRILLSDKVQT